jgi:hypothetical protein
MRNFHPGAVQPEHLPHVADDVADGLVLEGFGQGALNPFLQVQVIDLVDLDLAPARPYMNFCLVRVAAIAGGRDAVGLDFEPQVQVVAKAVFDQLGRVMEVPCVFKRSGLDLLVDDIDHALGLGHDGRCVASRDGFPAFFPLC